LSSLINGLQLFGQNVSSAGLDSSTSHATEQMFNHCHCREPVTWYVTAHSAENQLRRQTSIYGTTSS